jgi:F-type H+-transporting ATPase subunit delta
MAVEKQTLARPYARAIFELADSSDSLTEWSEMLELLRLTITDPQMAKLLGNPELGKQRLQQLLLEVTAGWINEPCKNLLLLLLENDRLDVMHEIAQGFEALKAQRQGSIQVTIISAFTVNKTQEKKLAESLKKRLGRDVHVSTEKDPSLIGGVKIRAGDLVIDGSIRNKLSRLATEFGI